MLKKTKTKKVVKVLKSLKKIKVEPQEFVAPQKSEKEFLLELYQTFKDYNIRSISDLENLIARAE